MLLVVVVLVEIAAAEVGGGKATADCVVTKT